MTQHKKDKIEILFETKEKVFERFYIDFDKGIIYDRKAYEKNKMKTIGRPTTGNLYTRVSVPCPNHTHIWKRGNTDVLAHRLIFYAFHGYLPEKVDHDNKFDPYPNRIQNLKVSDSFHNRMNTEKIEVDLTQISDPIEKELKKYRSISYAYGYYWAKFRGKILNENGFISAILCANYRNNHIRKEFIEKYGSLENLPLNALDTIDQNELFLDQMLQEAQEANEYYWLKQKEISLKRNNESQQKLQTQLEFKDYFQEFLV